MQFLVQTLMIPDQSQAVFVARAFKFPLNSSPPVGRGVTGCSLDRDLHKDSMALCPGPLWMYNTQMPYSAIILRGGH